MELWISSDTLFSRSCLARLPNTNSMASMTLDLPEPLGPTTEEKDCEVGVLDRGGGAGLGTWLQGGGLPGIKRACLIGK